MLVGSSSLTFCGGVGLKFPKEDTTSGGCQ
jgi:hypothetical protein